MKKQKHSDSDHNSLNSSPSHLLHRVLQIALDQYGSEVGEGGLTQRQYALLKAIDDHKGPDGKSLSAMSQTDLVVATGIDRSTLADMVTRMTTKGLLMREKSTSDARANLISLSDQGKAALIEIAPKVAKADDAILALLSPPKREGFVKLLRKLAHAREPNPKTGVANHGETLTAKVKKDKKPKAIKAEGLGDKKKKIKKTIKKKVKALMPQMTNGVVITDETADA